jgi:hypothetical protein
MDVPSSKVLFCRPLGGLNDTLCRVADCLEHSQKFGRRLVVDTSFSGLMADFNEIFEVVDGPDGVVIESANNPRTSISFNTFAPDLLGTELSAKDFLQGTKYRESLRRGGPEITCKVDLKTTFEEDLVIYHARGGGQQSHKLLEHISLTPRIRAEVSRSAKSLPRAYAAVHVRHTDYKTLFEYFSATILREARGLPILVVSDNPEIFPVAEDLLVGSEVFFTHQARRAITGQPLHSRENHVDDLSRYGAMVATFTDLYALANADVLIALPVFANKKRNRVTYSGYSTLAGYLLKNPDLSRQFFGVPLKRAHVSTRFVPARGFGLLRMNLQTLSPKLRLLGKKLSTSLK